MVHRVIDWSLETQPSFMFYGCHLLFARSYTRTNKDTKTDGLDRSANTSHISVCAENMSSADISYVHHI